MIKKEYGKFIVACDVCYEQLGNFETFDEAREAINQNNWETEKIAETYMNYCEECYKIGG